MTKTGLNCVILKKETTAKIFLDLDIAFYYLSEKGRQAQEPRHTAGPTRISRTDPGFLAINPTWLGIHASQNDL